MSVLELLCLDLFGEKRLVSHSTLRTLVSEFWLTIRWLFSPAESAEASGDLGGGRMIRKMQSTMLEESSGLSG